MPNYSALAAMLVTLFAWGDGSARTVVHVPCDANGVACAQALQAAIDHAPPGTTITLDPGKVYHGSIVIKPKPGADDPETRLTITTRGWTDKGAGWDGLVTPGDKPRLAVLRGADRSNVGIDIRNGPTGGRVNLFGLALEAIPPRGHGEIIRIGSADEREAANMARHISIRQVLIQGDREFGQKRGIQANGGDIDIRQVWCEEIFTPGQDAQCLGSWNGGQRVRVQFAYLAAGAENVLVGGGAIATAQMQPQDWIIEDVILHKPLRWQQDRRNRQVKNLLEFKHGKNLTARRILAVNNWRAAQAGLGLLINYTTNGRCPECGGLENILIEDLVMLNVEGGIGFQGYAWQPDSHNDRKLRGVTVRNAYVQLSKPGRTIQISNVLGEHDIRIERSTFIGRSRAWLSGSYGRAWPDPEASTPGGPMKGLWLLDNVVTSNGRYGITAPGGHHYGSGIGTFVAAALQIAGNVIGDAPPDHLTNYDEHRHGGAPNIGASGAQMSATLTGQACAEWAPGKGADCARLAPIFALLRRLPEP